MFKKIVALTLVLLCVAAQALASNVALDLQNDGAKVAASGQEAYFFTKEAGEWVLTSSRNAYFGYDPLIKLGSSTPNRVLYATDEWVYFSLVSSAIVDNTEKEPQPAIELWRVKVGTGDCELLVDDVLASGFYTLDGQSVLFYRVSDTKTVAYYNFEKAQLASVVRFENGDLLNAHLSKTGQLFLYIYNGQTDMLEMWQIGVKATQMPDPDIEVFRGRFLTGDQDNYYVYQGRETDGPIYLADLYAIDKAVVAPSTVRVSTTAHGYYYENTDLEGGISQLMQIEALTGKVQTFHYPVAPDYFTVNGIGDRIFVLDGQGEVHMLNEADFSDTRVVANMPVEAFKEGIWVAVYPFQQYVLLLGRERMLTDDEAYAPPELVRVLPTQYESGGVVVIEGSPFATEEGAQVVVDPDNPFALTPESPEGGLILQRHGGLNN